MNSDSGQRSEYLDVIQFFLRKLMQTLVIENFPFTFPLGNVSTYANDANDIALFITPRDFEVRNQPSFPSALLKGSS